MYEIYAEKELDSGYKLIYSDVTPLEEYKLSNPVLDLEENCAGSLNITISPNQVGYKEIEMLKSTIKVYKNGNEIWEGRPISENINFWNNRDIYCEGELSYLNDTCQPQQGYNTEGCPTVTLAQFVEAVLNNHNTKARKDRKFKVRHCPTITNFTNTYRQVQYEKTLEVINNLIEEYKLHIKVVKVKVNNEMVRYIDIYKDYEVTTNSVIEFGLNLKDITKAFDYSEFATVLLPLGEVNDDAKLYTNIEYQRRSAPNGWVIYEDNDNWYVGSLSSEYLPGQTLGDALGIPSSDWNNYYVSEGTLPIDPVTKQYIFTGKMNRGLGMYLLQKADGVTAHHRAANSGAEFTYEENEAISDISNDVTQIWVAGYNDPTSPTTYITQVKYLQKVQNAMSNFLSVAELDKSDSPKGSMYITNQALVNKFGWIEKQLTWENVTSAEDLYAKGHDYISDGQFDGMEIEVNAVDMSLIGYDLDPYDILSLVKVTDLNHELYYKELPITKMHLTLNRPDDMTLSLGRKREQNLTQVNNNTNEELLNKINTKPEFSEMLISAKKTAALQVTTATEGKVTLLKNDDGTPKAVIISNLEDYTSSSAHGWLLNEAGWIYFTNGLNPDNPQASIVIAGADGHLVADAITTGTLRAINIEGCNMKIGRVDNRDADLKLYDGNGKLRGRIYTTANGSTFFECSSDYNIGDPNGGYFSRFNNGFVEFGKGYGGDTVSIIGKIQGNTAFEVDGQTKLGIDIVSPEMLMIECNRLGVCHNASDVTYTNADDYISYIKGFDGDGNPVYGQLRFMNGIFVQDIE